MGRLQLRRSAHEEGFAFRRADDDDLRLHYRHQRRLGPGRDDRVLGQSHRGTDAVSSDGGIPEPITELAEGELSHDWPAFVPSGEAVLFTLGSNSLDDARLAVVLLSTGERRLLGGGFFPRFASTGHLIYGQAGAVWAVPFDADRLEMTGDPVQVLEGVRVEGGGAVQFDLAENGAAVYIAGGLNRAERTLVWVDREGREEPLNVPRRAYQAVSISPDGTRIALEMLGSGLEDLWLYDVHGQRASQFTFDAADDVQPVWTPDGERVLYLSQRGGPYGLFSKRADGTGQPEQLASFEGRPQPGRLLPTVGRWPTRSRPRRPVGTFAVWILKASLCCSRCL